MSDRKAKKTKIKLCQNHPEEDLKFYCTAHNDVICSICAVYRHQQCQNKVLTFPDAIKRFEQERNNLFKALDNQSRVIDETVIMKREALESIQPEVDQIKLKFSNLRSTLNGLIDKSESELLRKVEDIKKQQSLKLKEDIENLEDLSAAAVKVKEKAQEAFDKSSDLHIITSIVKVQNAYCEIERCAKANLDQYGGRITLDISQSIQQFIKHFDSLGTVSNVGEDYLMINITETAKEQFETPNFLHLRSHESTTMKSTSGASEYCPSRLPLSLEDIDSSSEEE